MSYLPSRMDDLLPISLEKERRMPGLKYVIFVSTNIKAYTKIYVGETCGQFFLNPHLHCIIYACMSMKGETN